MQSIEYEIFKRSKVNEDKLIKYGFIKDKNNYVFEKEFMDEFKAIITVDNKSNVNGKVIDLETNEEYLNLRTQIIGNFSSRVREEYMSILIDIKKNCFETRYFISNQSNRITSYIKNKYNDEPEFLWKDSDGTGVFRNKNSNKWYGIIMNIDYSKVDKNKKGEIEVINIKLDKDKILDLIKINGYYEAYHMSKKYWISIVLNDTLKDEEITNLIDESYNLVK